MVGQEILDIAICRREFLKKCIVASAAVGGTNFAYPDGRQTYGDSVVNVLISSDARHLRSAVVRPVIGTGAHGHTFPGATVPFSLVQLSPESAGGFEPHWWNGLSMYQWDHDGGYHFPDNVIIGFSHTHVSGTGGEALGDVLLMPTIGAVRWNPGAPGDTYCGGHWKGHVKTSAQWELQSRDHGYCSRFSHQNETIRAGYYSVLLDDFGVLAELTATTRCGMHRYTFPTGKSSHVILDLVHALDETVYEAQLNVENTTTVSGYRGTHGWAPDRQVYFVIEFSRPFASCLVQQNGKVQAGDIGSVSGPKLKAAFNFSKTDGDPLLIKVGISGTGIEGARKNLQAEIPHWNFNEVAVQATEQWNNALGTLEAQLPNKELTQTFYTAAYHGMIGPTTFNDVDGKYRGEDHRNHSNPGFTNYTTLSIWDIYRTQFPFMMLTHPDRITDVMRTFLASYHQLNQDSLPVWPLWGFDSLGGMTGFHAVAMILGAFTREFRNWDVAAMYEAMKVTAMNDRNYQNQFRQYGFVPTEELPAPGKQSVSRTLDYAYDCWCVGAMAELLKKYDDAKMFYNFGQNYKNLFDPKVGFMRGKTKDGKWRDPFRPDWEYRSDYTESDAWQATFNVMHDVRGLIDLYGGDQQFIAKLDALFTASSKVYHAKPDISGMVGQDAQGNEPSNHIPYLYPFAGAAWKTQYWVRKVAALYNNTSNGIPGNDDCGQLSSWFVLTAMGFYPVNPATGVYVIGSPLINRAKIHNRATGTTFSIIAENNSVGNLYIQSAKLNERELTRSWFTHADIVAGGELYFRMGRTPNKDWASAKADRPPSGLVIS